MNFTKAIVSPRIYWIAAIPIFLVACNRQSIDVKSPEQSPQVSTSTDTTLASEVDKGFLYGKVATADGATYRGRLRWGGSEEAFWGDYFNGFKDTNPWTTDVPPEYLRETKQIKVLGIDFGSREQEIDLGRPFMRRFGDISRIAVRGNDIVVTLKSGTVVELDRLSADDLADGLRVWDSTHGVIDLDEKDIRIVEFLPTAQLDSSPGRLFGTVHTQNREFRGYVQWNREKGVSSDVLGGYSDGENVQISFDEIQSIVRDADNNSLVTSIDGSEVLLSSTREVGPSNRGIYVDDERYGRVLVSWPAFEQIEFDNNGSGPAYADFPESFSLNGSVTTRGGRLIAGRIVFDLDESETTETLDAPKEGIDYTILFGLIHSIERPGNPEDPVKVTLHSGEQLELERRGDLGDGNAGMLVFVDGTEASEYVSWADVALVNLDRPAEMYPVSVERVANAN